MQGNVKILVGAVMFIAVSVFAAEKSNAFNSFTDAKDERKMNQNAANGAANNTAVLEEIRNVDIQILQQLKEMNQLLRRNAVVGGNAQTQQNQQPQAGNAPVPLIRANP